MDAWENDIKTFGEVRGLDIINVNNDFIKPIYIYNLPKNDFSPQHIISLQMNVTLLLWSVIATVWSNFENILYLIS